MSESDPDEDYVPRWSVMREGGLHLDLDRDGYLYLSRHDSQDAWDNIGGLEVVCIKLTSKQYLQIHPEIKKQEKWRKLLKD